MPSLGRRWMVGINKASCLVLDKVRLYSFQDSHIMDSLTDLIKGATVGPNSGSRVPGLAFQVIDRNGNILNSTVSGVKSIIGGEPITEDSVFYVASMTKWVTSIALMQLVEQGKVDLDSADQLEDLCPELKSVRILEGFDEKGQPILREKKTRITLRHLNSHQSKVDPGTDTMCTDKTRWIFIHIP